MSSMSLAMRCSLDHSQRRDPSFSKKEKGLRRLSNQVWWRLHKLPKEWWSVDQSVDRYWVLLDQSSCLWCSTYPSKTVLLWVLQYISRKPRCKWRSWRISDLPKTVCITRRNKLAMSKSSSRSFRSEGHAVEGQVTNPTRSTKECLQTDKLLLYSSCSQIWMKENLFLLQIIITSFDNDKKNRST